MRSSSRVRRAVSPESAVALRAIAVLSCVVALLPLAEAGDARSADPNKILRLASPDIETLDPHQISDSPSSDVADAIFEGLYEWDYLASPARLAPLVAAGLPEITEGGTVWTIRMKSGIRFTDDPAFAGKRRELTADHIVYSLKRVLDPNLRRGGAPIITDLVAGAREIVDAASRPGGSFDYDRPMAGLRALDRHSLQLRLTAPLPESGLRFVRRLVAGASASVRACGNGENMPGCNRMGFNAAFPARRSTA